MDTTPGSDTVRAAVQEKYGSAALRVVQGETDATCCGSSGCCGATTAAWDPITSNLYDEGQTSGIPAEALLASLGCGNPTALATLNEGETVLALGPGGGIDVLLSAKRVGASGKDYGPAMTDAMLAPANENRRKPGAHTVEFKFSLPSKPFYVTLTALVVGICLCGVLIFYVRKPQTVAKN